MKSKGELKGRWSVRCVGADGVEKWREDFSNGVTTEGRNHLLDVGFHGSTQAGTWYIGLISGTGYSALAAADTLASHSGWQEGTPYSGNRPAWTEGAASSGSITNGTSVDITCNASTTVKGAFLCSVASGTSGTLYSTGLFTQGDRTVVSGDVLKITYTLTLTAS